MFPWLGLSEAIVLTCDSQVGVAAYLVLIIHATALIALEQAVAAQLDGTTDCCRNGVGVVDHAAVGDTSARDGERVG